MSDVFMCLYRKGKKKKILYNTQDSQSDEFQLSCKAVQSHSSILNFSQSDELTPEICISK